VLQTTAAVKEVIGEIQDIIALVIRQVPLQEVEALVDVRIRPSLRARRWMAPMPPGAMVRVRSAIS
jgi:hypothetical protein